MRQGDHQKPGFFCQAYCRGLPYQRWGIQKPGFVTTGFFFGL